jgi:H+/Cl- antiporter ClcA
MLEFLIDIVLLAAIGAIFTLIGILIVWVVTRGRARFDEKRGDLYEIVGAVFFLLICVILYFAFPSLRPK